MYSVKDLQSLISVEIENEIYSLNQTEPKNLYQPVGYALSMGGKRLRPVMVLMAYNLFSENVENAFPVALAIELFHNFTLLHDDIMDGAEMRRNNLSVYKKYNENIAILSGDAMSIMAYNYLLKCNSTEPAPMIRLFSQTALEVCEGQQFDMDFENRLDVSIPEYLEMIRLKTAVLLACSLKLGAMAANAPEKIADQLYNFGLNLGITFQLQDDLLDVFADQDKFGKKIGGDIVSNKKTFLLLKALEISDDSTKMIILDWMNKSDFDENEKIRAITEVYNKLDIKGITEIYIDQYYKLALDVFTEINLAGETMTELIQLANLIMNRDH
ncbi:dimethylallyltransferase [Aquipluma nitroreducens]|uniref:Dimethylallyltransferase n=1 Tax=Aquipluma nitroreducens TaxID=2010828 RepID=A0A5K7SA33_9BACT|nr:polyprenyl synthetase family protein [Aquipluma nitroreducens]BBE18326.1 dimethylallyltransferase [Aquipluma nitroreducens]